MTWGPTNAEQMIPREHIAGTLKGVDFGPRVFVIARADKPMLLWLRGHSWTNNGHVSYSESHLTTIKDRSAMDGWRNYKGLDPRGGRLTVDRVEAAKPAILAVFDESYWAGIIHAVKTKQTLLIEGGGEEPMPHPSFGRDAYLKWRERMRVTA